jgi:LacI family transcriptional regulator
VVTRASSDDGGEDPQLAAAMAHLRANLHRPLDVVALARAAGLPRRSLERVFRTALGRSPLDEIRRQRIARAQELLAHSDLPLDQIAQRTGFSGPDRLGVVFRQVAGSTPGSWRRQHQAR